MHAGATLSGAMCFRFRHNDMSHLKVLLEEHRAAAANALILTDGVFSMDGDLAALPDLAALAKEFAAWLMSDDAHGIGVVGGGHGSTFAFGDAVTPEDIPLQMGTLSKAIGSTGGYLCASKVVIDLIKTRARTLIYSTGLSPAAAGAALRALDLIEDSPELCARPVENAARFAKALGLARPQSPIVPLILGGEEKTLEASEVLEGEGFLVTAIRPPTVPEGTSRLRFTFTAAHRGEDIDRLADVVRTQIMAKAAAE